MKLARRAFLHLAAGAAALPMSSRFARAQAYPARPITLVVTFPAGSAPDIIARHSTTDAEMRQPDLRMLPVSAKPQSFNSDACFMWPTF